MEFDLFCKTALSGALGALVGFVNDHRLGRIRSKYCQRFFADVVVGGILGWFVWQLILDPGDSRISVASFFAGLVGKPLTVDAVRSEMARRAVAVIAQPDLPPDSPAEG